MKALTIAVTAMFVVVLAGALGLVAFVTVASGAAGSATAAVTVSNPSDEAVADIPALLLELFITEARQCPGLPWQVMAGISKVESNHARHGGATIGLDGNVQPPIIGIALDGTNGTARISDTDNGVWDGDSAWDRAVGPFQFIPSSWRIFGADVNNDGTADYVKACRAGRLRSRATSLPAALCYSLSQYGSRRLSRCRDAHVARWPRPRW